MSSHLFEVLYDTSIEMTERELDNFIECNTDIITDVNDVELDNRQVRKLNGR